METERIIRLWSNLYDGDPWTWIKLIDILKDVTPTQAASHPIPDANSIWQLTKHCLGWRQNVLRKMKGEKFTSPDDNYLSEPPNTADSSWKRLLEDLTQNQQDWIAFLETMDDATLDEKYAPVGDKYSKYDLIHGLMHHDNYHFGQITLLKKCILQS